MIRGLFSNWKQPIYANSDSSMNMKLLIETITKVYKAGFEVVATSSDCGGGNVGIWSGINLEEGRTYILHPVTQRKIFLFADAPHVLKLIRNWLLDTGFILADGEIITHEPLFSLVSKDASEVSDTFFLKEEHLTCQGSQRQNVSWAAKVLSRKSSIALLRKVNTLSAKRLANFILKVNNWWDVVNSRCPNESQILKRPYGMNLDDQNHVLEEMEDMIKGMIATGKSTLQVNYKKKTCRKTPRYTQYLIRFFLLF